MKVCIYCGKINPETKDHVPPKGIFAPPRPKNLKTVPCCSECHTNTTNDDEYFRNMLAMRADTNNHPDVQGVLPKIYRALANPQQIKFTKHLINNIKTTNLVTPKGIYIGSAAVYEVNKFRLDKVVERTVKGLYWHERGKIFPLNGSVKSYLIDDLSIFEPKEIDRIIEILSTAEEKVIGNNTVKYKISIGAEEYVEIWLLTFYEKVEFLTFLLPQWFVMN